jgi:hypothetical protein
MEASAQKIEVVGTASRPLVALTCGGAFAAWELDFHAHVSGNDWISSRYYGLGQGWQVADALLALFAGAVLSWRLAWLASSVLLSLVGQALPLSRIYKWDMIFLGAPSVLLSYLLYVANVRNRPFLPFGSIILVLCILPLVVALTGRCRQPRPGSQGEVHPKIKALPR